MFQFTLEPYNGMKSRYTCPSCRKGKTFTRYINTETGEHLAESVGKCDRELNCSYHFTPKQYFDENKPFLENCRKVMLKKAFQKKQSITKPISFIPVHLFKQTLNSHANNNLVNYLISLYGVELVSEAVSRYFIGTSDHWTGATILWQIDVSGNIRTGKIMLYDAITGKRVKKPYNHINWVHSVLKLPEFNLQQCFFGEHLLQVEPSKPVAIVESEKTAIIASLYLPQFVWLACGSLSNLTAKKCEVLTGRKVTLFPDLNAFGKWTVKANDFSSITQFIVSDLLEKNASEDEKKDGLDLADYLVRFKLEEFQPKSNMENIKSTDVIALLGETHTGKDFENLVIAGIKTKANKIYDLIFNADGEPIRPGEQVEAVNRLAVFFEKTFRPALFDNKSCLIHI